MATRRFPSPPGLTSKPMSSAPKLYGGRAFSHDQKVRVAFSGQATDFDIFNGCMEITTATGLSHYVFDADPAITLRSAEETWPPVADDVWLIGGRVWHVDHRGMLYRASKSANPSGSFGYIRSAENVLHSADKPPEMLFRFNV